MSFGTLIARFAEQAPIATMVRGLMANVLSPAELNALFRETAERQHESPLLFSTIVDLLSLVVSKAQRLVARGLSNTPSRTVGVAGSAL